MKCPFHKSELVRGKCITCGMTEEQLTARVKGSTVATVAANPPTTAESKSVEQLPTHASEAEPSFEQRISYLEGVVHGLTERNARLENNVQQLGLFTDRMVNSIDALARSVNSLQSIVLLHAQEFGAVERLFGYMHAEREFVARRLGVKTMREIEDAFATFHAEKDATPSPSAPIAPEEESGPVSTTVPVAPNDA